MIDIRPNARALEQYYREGSWRHETIGELIARQVSIHAGKTAIKDSAGNSLSYGELEDKAARLGAFLASRNVGRGDVLPCNCPTAAR